MSTRKSCFSRVWDDRLCLYWRPTIWEIVLLQSERDTAEPKGSWHAISCNSSVGSLSSMERQWFSHVDSKCAMIDGFWWVGGKKIERIRGIKQARSRRNKIGKGLQSDRKTRECKSNFEIEWYYENYFLIALWENDHISFQAVAKRLIPPRFLKFYPLSAQH